MTLRFGPLRVRTAVRWPQVETVSLALVLTDELSPTDSWVQSCVVVGLAAGTPGSTELAALQWVSEHLGEFGAERDRMLVAGGARAARLALAARDSGWPVLRRQLLVHPSFAPEQPMPVNVAGAPPATVVCGGRTTAAADTRSGCAPPGSRSARCPMTVSLRASSQAVTIAPN